mmetsp:Transcript_20394/g.47189  ORF Transcript_20394/g.47189 Transcript_20394/m.47189 type:complete len:81 (+) Transcript_20394:1058-1300(+)
MDLYWLYAGEKSPLPTALEPLRLNPPRVIMLVAVESGEEIFLQVISILEGQKWLLLRIPLSHARACVPVRSNVVQPSQCL